MSKAKFGPGTGLKGKRKMKRTHKDRVKKYGLLVPDQYWLFSDAELDFMECGAGHGLGAKLVPETIYLLNISTACTIHDVEWALAESIEDLELANIRFLINLLKIINAESNFLTRMPRRYRATTYYNAVEDIGKKSFAKKFNKEK